MENNLKYGQYELLNNIHRVWYAGWNSDDIARICRKAELKPDAVRAVSVYMWNKLLAGNYNKREKSALVIGLIYSGLTGIGALIIGTILSIIFGISTVTASTGRHTSFAEVYYIIGFIICSPIAGIGWYIQTKVQERQVKSQRSAVLDSWPKGMYPGNVAPDEAI